MFTEACTRGEIKQDMHFWSNVSSVQGKCEKPHAVLLQLSAYGNCNILVVTIGCC